MNSNTSTTQFSEQTLRQVASDSQRAMIRARYCVERSRIQHFHCADDQPETDSSFGRQLWYFDGVGYDELDRRTQVFGVIEYSIQYGLHELVEDGVFEASEQRDRFRYAYKGLRPPVSWQDPANRLMVSVIFAMVCAVLGALLFGLFI